MPSSDSFLLAVAIVLEHEGGWADDPFDPGGATNYGISLRFLKSIGDLDGDGWLDGDLDRDGDVDWQDIRKMSRAQAIDFYRVHFWDKYGYGRIADAELAAKVFDLAVNMGSVQAHRCLQRALRACGLPVADDGVIGPKTLAALNAPRNWSPILTPLKSEAAGFYRGLVIAKPIRQKYLSGWLNRAYS